MARLCIELYKGLKYKGAAVNSASRYVLPPYYPLSYSKGKTAQPLYERWVLAPCTLQVSFTPLPVPVFHPPSFTTETISSVSMPGPSADRPGSHFTMVSYMQSQPQRPDSYLDISEQFRRDDSWRKVQQARADRQTRGEQTETSLKFPSTETRHSALPSHPSTSKRSARVTGTPSKRGTNDNKYVTEPCTSRDHRPHGSVPSSGLSKPLASAPTGHSRPVNSIHHPTEYSERKSYRRNLPIAEVTPRVVASPISPLHCRCTANRFSQR